MRLLQQSLNPYEDVYAQFYCTAGKVDLVTETDKECERVIFRFLKEQFPKHVYIGEEDTAARGGAPELTEEPTWMIDPIDGKSEVRAACRLIPADGHGLVSGRVQDIAVVPVHDMTSTKKKDIICRAGTCNFVHRFPFVCVSIALVSKRQPLIAVVFNPIMDELYVATQ